jgi:hypothetical protein
VHGATAPFEATDTFIRVDQDHQQVAQLAGHFQAGNMTGVQYVEASPSGYHYAARHPGTFHQSGRVVRLCRENVR